MVSQLIVDRKKTIEDYKNKINKMLSDINIEFEELISFGDVDFFSLHKIFNEKIKQEIDNFFISIDNAEEQELIIMNLTFFSNVVNYLSSIHSNLNSALRNEKNTGETIDRIKKNRKHYVSNTHNYIINLLSNMKNIFTDNMYNNLYIKSMVDNKIEEKEELISSYREIINKVCKNGFEIDKTMKELKNELDSIKLEANEIIYTKSRDEKIEQYWKAEKKFKSLANRFMWVAILMFGGLAILAWYIFKHEIKLEYLPASIICLSFLTYCTIMEKRYRNKYFKYLDLRISISTLPSYLRSIKQGEKTEELKRDMAKLYFGNIHNDEKFNEKDVIDVIDKVAKISNSRK